MKKLLVLGTSHSQLDLVKVAKDMGLYVIAIGMSEDDVAVKHVDKFIKANILDEKQVDEIVKKEKVDAIFTMGLEIALPVMTRVSLNNGLRSFITEESIRKFSNKYIWRKEIGDIAANIYAISGSKIEDFAQFDRYPAVLKPADGSGQRGVREVSDFEEVKKVFDESISYSKQGILILEEYARGEEISVNAYMYNGELAFYVISDRISYDEYPGGIVKEHHIPSKYDNSEVREKIEELVKTVSEKMDYQNGHVYYQLKVYNNTPKLIEFTPRYDGCHMWNLIKYSMGINLVKASIEWLINGSSEEIENYKYYMKEGKYKTIFISDKPATIINRDNYKIPDQVLYLNWYYQNGQSVKKVTGYMEKAGYYIIKE